MHATQNGAPPSSLLPHTPAVLVNVGDHLLDLLLLGLKAERAAWRVLKQGDGWIFERATHSAASARATKKNAFARAALNTQHTTAPTPITMALKRSQ
jgi:hypothetical protein